MIQTEFTPGKRLVLEMPKGEEDSQRMATACMLSVLGVPFFVLGIYCVATGTTIPSNTYFLIAESLLLAFALFICFVPLPRKVSITPGDAREDAAGDHAGGHCVLQIDRMLGLLKFKTSSRSKPDKLIIRLNRGVFGETNVDIQTTLDKPEPGNLFLVAFVNTERDVEEFAGLVANAGHFAYVKKQEDSKGRYFVLSNEPSDDDIAVPPDLQGLPFHAVDCSRIRMSKDLVHFDANRAAPVAAVQDWQPQRHLELKQDLPDQDAAFKLMRFSFLLAIPAGLWALAVLRSWPGATPLERGVWTAAAVLFGISAMAMTIQRLCMWRHTLTTIDKEREIRSRNGVFFFSKIPREEIEYLYVEHVEKEKDTPEKHRLRMFVVSGRKTASYIDSKWMPEPEEVSAAMLMIAMECGRILNRPVYAQGSLLKTLKLELQ